MEKYPVMQAQYRLLLSLILNFVALQVAHRAALTQVSQLKSHLEQTAALLWK